MSISKIGILTYHSVPNFGANLQAYSTVGYFKTKGFEPIIINWVPIELDNYGKNNPSEQNESHYKFIREKLPLTELCRTSEDVARVIEENDIKGVVIGSDVVLQHSTLFSRLMLRKTGIKIRPKRSDTTFPNPFWGGFIPFLSRKIPVSIMSAASPNMHYKSIRGMFRAKIKNALSKFDNIYVRDVFTQNMVSYFTGNDPIPNISPDPVFSFNQNIAEQKSKKQIVEQFKLPENYVLFSFKNRGIVTEDWLQKSNKLLLESRKEGVVLTTPGGVVFSNHGLKSIEPPLDPMDWYALIKYSSGYIGENMHPIVVSLHNSVPFYAFDDYGKIKFKYFVDVSSSKINNIVSFSGFGKHYVNTLDRNYSAPTPEKVIKMINNFDLEKCKRFSEKQVERYNEMMGNIVSGIK